MTRRRFRRFPFPASALREARRFLALGRASYPSGRAMARRADGTPRPSWRDVIRYLQSRRLVHMRLDPRVVRRAVLRGGPV